MTNIKGRSLFCLLISLVLLVISITGCASPTAFPASTPTLSSAWTPASTPTKLLPLPSPTATMTLTPSPLPSLTSTPLNHIRNTPMTLMLHPATQVFDPVAFLKGFIALLEVNEIKVITYQDILKDPDITAREQGKLAIITIDDIYLQSRLDSSVEKMISLLLEANYRAVLGVVTQGSAPNAETSGLLKHLSEAGWEIATHTDTHTNLGELEKLSPDSVSLEIRTSQDKIERAIGVRPDTLFLPYGQNVYNMKLLGKEGIIWVAGIGGGNSFDMAKDIFYVGRESPDGTPQMTFKMMMRRFNPEMQFP